MILVNVSAPTANYVAADVLQKPKSLVIARSVAAVECVQRYPVCTLAEDLNSVYKNAEISFFALCRTLSLESDLTDTE